MLIGISGYIGSGKDTVANMIIWLTNPEERKLWNNSLKDFLDIDHIGFNWEIKKFAGKLKQIVSLLTGIPVSDLEKESVKSSELPKDWDSVLRTIRGNDGKFVLVPGSVPEGMEDRAKKLTIRKLLQLLGTEACRNVIHENIWVNSLFVDYKPKLESRGVYPNWLISDTRFPNEAQAIKDRGVIVVRINRLYGNSEDLWDLKHSSETSLDTWKFDYTINNSGTIEELLESVRTMLLHFKIIT